MIAAQDWLTQLEADHTFRRTGLFRALEELPSLVIDGSAFDEKAMGSLLTALKNNTQAITDELKQYVDSAHLQAFAHTLFDIWIENQANPYDRWLLFSAARLGGESIASRIIAFWREIRAKRTPLQPRLSLEALVMNGTQPALLYVYEFCLTAGKTRLYNLARKMLEAYAAEQNLTFYQLGDRIVPDRDLNREVFDYGRRQFTGIINSDITPMIRNEQSKIREDLPKPGKRDDPTCAALAQINWREYRSLIASVKTTQSILLERAMVEERRWSAKEFDLFFRTHSIMRHFAQTLIWGAYEQNRLLECFYITPDLTLSDIHYQTFHMPTNAQIGIVHPVMLTEDERQAWNHILHDFEIIQLFPQLKRDLYFPTAEEHESSEITRFNGSLLFVTQFTRHKKGISRVDWKSHPSAEIQTIERNFQPSNILAKIEVRKTYRIESFYFESNNQKRSLDQVNPVIISEVLRDLKKAIYR